MKSKSNNYIILAFGLMISFFQQYFLQIIHYYHENIILSAQKFLNQQNIQLKTIASNQHELKLEHYVQTINAVISSIKFKLHNKLYAQLFTAVQQMINNIPNSTHPNHLLPQLY